MGCNDAPIINYENSYSVCTMTINNLTDELIKIFPLSDDKILACSCKNYKILDMNELKDKETHVFENEVFNLIMWNNLDSNFLIEGSCNGDLIIHDLETKENFRRGGHSGTILCLLLLKNGQLLTSSSEGEIFIWDPINDFQIVTHFKPHKSPIWSVCEISQDMIITTGDEGISKMLVLTKPQKDRCILRFNTPNCRHMIKIRKKRIVYNNNKDLIIYNIDKIPNISDDIPEIRKLKKNEPDFYIKDAHDFTITYILAIPTGEIISGDDGGVIKIIHSKFNFQCVSILTGHRGRINSLDVFPLDNKLVSCGDDKKIKFWERNKMNNNDSDDNQ